MTYTYPHLGERMKRPPNAPHYTQGTSKGGLEAADRGERDSGDRALEQAGTDEPSEADRYRTLVEAAAQVVWSADAGGKVVEISPSWLAFTGQSPDEAVGEGWAAAVYPDDRTRALEGWRSAVASESLVNTEVRIWHAPSESYRWMNVHAVPLRDEEDVLSGWVGMNIDIHERKHDEERVRAIASKLTMAEQHERRRISQILHDDIQQRLYGISMQVDFARKDCEAGLYENVMVQLDRIQEWLNDSVDALRNLTIEMTPPILRHEGLADALAWLAGFMEDVYGLRVSVRTVRPMRKLDEDTRILLFQGVRELLFNVAKHAGTREAAVDLREEDGQVLIVVSDDGKGFDPAESSARSGRRRGFGMANLSERLELFGGSMAVDTAPGRGTRVTLRIPARRQDAAG